MALEVTPMALTKSDGALVIACRHHARSAAIQRGRVMSTDLRQWFAAAVVAGITAVTVFVMPCAANAEPPNVEPQSVPYAVQRIGNPTPPAAPLRPFYDN